MNDVYTTTQVCRNLHESAVHALDILPDPAHSIDLLGCHMIVTRTYVRILQCVHIPVRRHFVGPRNCSNVTDQTLSRLWEGSGNETSTQAAFSVLLKKRPVRACANFLYRKPLYIRMISAEEKAYMSRTNTTHGHIH